MIHPVPAGSEVTAGVGRNRLRRATAQSHNRLHTHGPFVRLMSGDLTLSDYRLLLGRLYGFHLPLGAVLQAVPQQWRCGMDVHSMASLLRTDLAALDVASLHISALPTCSRLPVIASAAAFIGCVYVIEGSAMGGRIMAKRLDDLLGVGVRNGRRFFLGGPASDPSPWSQCCAVIEECAADGHIEAMVASAVDTFDALENWLQGGVEDVQAA